MKKIVLLLITSSLMHAVDMERLALSHDVIALGNRIVANALAHAQADAQEPLTGTVYESYVRLHEEGYQTVISENCASVAKALEYLQALTDKESTNEVVQNAIAAFEAAKALPKDTDKDVVVAAWAIELQLFVAALMNVAKKDFPDDLVMHPVAAQLILRNNGKVFADASKAAFEGALLATLGGYEKRRAAMDNEEIFKAVRALVYPTSVQ